MTDIRVCTQCNRTFDRAPGTNRRRCFKCAPARITAIADKGVPQVSRIGSAAPVDGAGVPAHAPVPVPRRTPGVIETRMVELLAQLGQGDTVEGALAQATARALDDDDLPGAQRTSMTKDLRTMIDNFRALVSPEEDAIDEFRDMARRKAIDFG